MKTIFSLTYPVAPNMPDADFAVTESEDGAIGIASGGAWVRIPFQAYEQLHAFLRDQMVRQGGGNPCLENPEGVTVKGESVAEGWHCGNGMLPEKFVMAAIANNPEAASLEVMQELDHIAWQAGPAMTAAAIERLLPTPLDDTEIPF